MKFLLNSLQYHFSNPLKMKKLLALLGITLLAGCQMPGYTDTEEEISTNAPGEEIVEVELTPIDDGPVPLTGDLPPEGEVNEIEE